MHRIPPYHVKYAFLIFYGLLLSLPSFSQNDFVRIGEINVEGLQHTKLLVVNRELDIHSGDTIELVTLKDVLLRNEKRLLSTGLFNLADINIKEWNSESAVIDLDIKLLENWYFYPAPIFELADRNFNVWWKEQNCSFSRVNYGLRFDHLNLTGRKDPVNFTFQTGYTRKYELDYQFPYFWGRWGLGGNIYYTENKEIGYTTVNNKTLFVKLPDEPLLLKRFRVTLNVQKRNSAFLYQSLQLQYNRRWINEEIALNYNPHFFLNGKSSLRFFQLEYDIKFDKRIFPTYPEGGYFMQLNVRKEGLGLGDDYDNLSVAVILEKHVKVYKSLYWGARFKAKTNLSEQNIPYILNSALGYGGDRVRGYELYVIDGSKYLLLKSSWRLKLLEHRYDISDVMKIKAFKVMPLTIYTRLTADAAYVIDDNEDIIANPLNKKFIYGYGPALDILLYNNYVISLEYTFNHFGESAFYFESAFNF